MADTVFENVCNVLAAVESDADLTARKFTFVKIKNTGVVDETIRVEATTVLGEQAFGVLVVSAKLLLVSLCLVGPMLSRLMLMVG